MSDSNEKMTPPRPRGGGLMGGGMRGAVEKPKDFWGAARRLLRYLRPQRVKLILVVILAIGSTAFAVWAPSVVTPFSCRWASSRRRCRSEARPRFSASESLTR